MFAFLERLKDPLLVWEFQYYFGIRKGEPADGQRPTDTELPPPPSPARQGGRSNRQHAGKQNGAPGSPGPRQQTTDSHNGSSTKLSNGTAHAVPQSSSTDSLTRRIASSDRNGSDLQDCRNHSHHDQPKTNGEKTTTTTFSPKQDSVGNLSDGGDGSSTSSSGDDGRAALAYIITRPFWYHLFSFGAALGDEAFYSSFFPFWFWNIDGAVCRRVVTMWVAIMYIGQGLKDVICWPRPSSPPVIRLEEKWAKEYGMPSTHAMVGFAVPFSLLFYTMYRYEYPVILGVLICSAWCCVVCGSRLYLGMHTVLDIVVGLILSFMLLVVLIPCVDALDAFSLSCPYSPLFVLSAYVAAAVLSPGAKHWTPTRGDTVMILGVGAGIALGSWLNFQWGIIRGPPMPPPYRILWPTYEMVGLTLLRTCIGIAVVVATRAAFKNTTYALACLLLGLDRHDRQVSQRRINVDLACKFVTYMAVAFNITYLSPAVFRLLNIERVTMFTEI